MIALKTILDVTAGAYGVTVEAIRAPGDGAAWEARAAFCWLARGFSGRAFAEMGMAVALPAETAEQACDQIAGRLNGGRDLDARLGAISVEIQALASLSDRIGLKLPAQPHPFDVARRLCRSKREAMSVGVDELMAVGAALIALSTRQTNADSRLVRAARAFERARAAELDAKFTINETPAARVAAGALKTLKDLIGA